MIIIFYVSEGRDTHLSLLRIITQGSLDQSNLTSATDSARAATSVNTSSQNNAIFVEEITKKIIAWKLKKYCSIWGLLWVISCAYRRRHANFLLSIDKLCDRLFSYLLGKFRLLNSINGIIRKINICLAYFTLLSCIRNEPLTRWWRLSVFCVFVITMVVSPITIGSRVML